MCRTAPIAVLCTLAVFGCAPDPEPRLVEPRPVDAPLTADDVRLALRLAAALPGSAAAICEEAFAVPDPWASDRTLPVAHLAAERIDRLHAALAAPRAVAALEADAGAFRLLGRAGWSAERYASTLVLIDLAAARPHWPDRTLAEFDRRAASARVALASDRRPFGGLDDAGRTAVRGRAAWLDRGVLVDRLRSLAPPTSDAVLAAGDAVDDALPAATRRPLDRLLTDLERYGIPFEEDDPARDDAALRFDPHGVSRHLRGDG